MQLFKQPHKPTYTRSYYYKKTQTQLTQSQMNMDTWNHFVFGFHLKFFFIIIIIIYILCYITAFTMCNASDLYTDSD